MAARARVQRTRGFAMMRVVPVCVLALTLLLRPRATAAQSQTAKIANIAWIMKIVGGHLAATTGVVFVFGMKTKTEPIGDTVMHLLEDDCIPYPRPQFVPSLYELALKATDAMQALHLDNGPGMSFLHYMTGIYKLLSDHPYSAFECPLMLTTIIRKAADGALAIGHRNRARVLLQIGNMFKLSAMSRWWTVVGEYRQKQEKPPKELQRFYPRMQMDYSLGLSVLTADLMEPALLEYRKSEWSLNNSTVNDRNEAEVDPHRPVIDVLSICVYKPDSTSNTVLESPLPQMSPKNHQQYVDFMQLNGYFLHTRLLTPPDVEAHYSKFLAVQQHFEKNPHTDWVFFIDCDAFFTDYDTSVYDLLETFGALRSAGKNSAPESPAQERQQQREVRAEMILSSGGEAEEEDAKTLLGETAGAPSSSSITSLKKEEGARRDATIENGAGKVNFIVAEDTGGINTGVFAIRNSVWSMEYLERVTRSPFTTAWDQSMFFMEVVNMTLWDYTDDFRLPPEVVFVHQRHLNAFVPPASKDWQAYEWQRGDFARHFAGCPWQEVPCLNMMYETMEYVEEKFGPALRAKGLPAIVLPEKGEYVTRLPRGIPT